MSQYRRDVEARLSCSDSSYDERDLSSSDGAHDYSSDEDSDDIEDGARMGKIRTRKHLDWSHTSTNPLGLLTTRRLWKAARRRAKLPAWRLNNTSWYVLVV